MDGAKLATDTTDYPKGYVVDRRPIWTEAFLEENVDRIEMRIPVVVGSKHSEKLCH